MLDKKDNIIDKEYVLIVETQSRGYVWGVYPSLENTKKEIEFLFSNESPFRKEEFTLTYPNYAFRNKYETDGAAIGEPYSEHIERSNGFLTSIIIDTDNSDKVIEAFIKERRVL